ncbi:MAG: energy-coupling factor transporter transmembrane protein EcfT [Treponema sp.]|jgi:energy-coupling factor transporter transmembrane protein EcfT|nr:energy-coupling factor transporter transmembrane protein EcfT [Treponema sp.]
MARLTPVAPYSYRSGATLLHRTAPGLKLLVLLFITTAVFLFGPCAVLVSALFISALALRAGIKPWELLRGAKALIFMLVLVLCVRSFSFSPAIGPAGGVFPVPAFELSGFIDALLFGGKILASFAAGALFFSVTTQASLLLSLEKAERLFFKPAVWLFRRFKGRGGKKLALILSQPKLSLAVSLMLGFLPRFFVVWEEAETAYRARGGKRGLRALTALGLLVTERMMEAAVETASAMESRGASLRYRG